MKSPNTGADKKERFQSFAWRIYGDKMFGGIGGQRVLVDCYGEQCEVRGKLFHVPWHSRLQAQVSVSKLTGFRYAALRTMTICLFWVGALPPSPLGLSMHISFHLSPVR